LGLSLSVENAGTEATADVLIRNRLVPDQIESWSDDYFPDPRWKPNNFTGVLAEVISRGDSPEFPSGQYTIHARIGPVLFHLSVSVEDWWQGDTSSSSPIQDHPRVQELRKAFDLIYDQWQHSQFVTRPMRFSSARNEVEEFSNGQWQPVQPQPKLRDDTLRLEAWDDYAWWPVLVDPPEADSWTPDYLDYLDSVKPIIPGEILMSVVGYEVMRDKLRRRR
jgi:hypothetical protein